MTSHDSWQELRTAWQSRESDDGVRAARGAVSRAGRRSFFARTGLVLFTVVMIGGALLHAANPLEAALGLGTGVAIAVAWWVSAVADRRTQAALGESGETYREARADILRTELRSMRTIWLILTLLLVFFVPWWLGGIAAHRGEGLFSALMLLAFWVPLAVIGVLFSWTLRRRRMARQELPVSDERGHDAGFAPRKTRR